MAEPIKVDIVASVDKSSFKKWEDDIKWFNKRIQSQTAIQLSARLAGLRKNLEEARKQIKVFREQWDKDAELRLRARTELLKKDISQANRELNNFLRTGNKAKSVLWWLFQSVSSWFNNVVSSIARIGWAIFAIQQGAAVFKEFTSTAISFESAFAWVRKTVDGTEWQLKQLRGELLDLTRQIPLSFEEISWIAELWWQLWVAREDIGEFTDTIARLGVTTNLTTEEAATSFARLANVFWLPISEVEKLWSVVVELGNNFATTESEIVNFTRFLWPAANAAWFTAQDVLAIGTAFSSVWINAEAGWSALSKTIATIQAAVVEWWKDLERFAEVSWKSAEDFADAFREDWAGALAEFIDWLSDAWERAGPIIEELVGSDVRLKNALLAAAWATGILTDALDAANKEFEEANALQIESEQRFWTTESQLQILENRLQEQKALIWQWLLPLYVSLNETFISIISSITWFWKSLWDVNSAVWQARWQFDTVKESLTTIKDEIKLTKQAIDDANQSFLESSWWTEEYTKTIGELTSRLQELESAQEETEWLLSRSKKNLVEVSAEANKYNIALRQQKWFLDNWSISLEEYAENVEAIQRKQRVLRWETVKLSEATEKVATVIWAVNAWANQFTTVKIRKELESQRQAAIKLVEANLALVESNAAVWWASWAAAAAWFLASAERALETVKKIWAIDTSEVLGPVSDDDTWDRPTWWAAARVREQEKLLDLKEIERQVDEEIRELQEKKNDELKAAADDVLDAFNDKLKDQQKVIEDIGKEIEKNIGKIQEIEKELSDLGQSESEQLWQRFVEIEKRLREWWLGWDEILSLWREQQFIRSQIWSEWIQEAQRVGSLSEAEGISESFERDRQELESKKESLEAQNKLLEENLLEQEEALTTLRDKQIAFEQQITTNLEFELVKRKQLIDDFIASLPEWFGWLWAAPQIWTAATATADWASNTQTTNVTNNININWSNLSWRQLERAVSWWATSLAEKQSQWIPS